MVNEKDTIIMQNNNDNTNGLRHLSSLSKR